MKIVKLVIVVLAAILAISVFTTVDARLNQHLVLQAMGIKTVSSGCKEKWCDSCLCDRKMPPTCWCNDLGPACYDTCEFCLCTRSIPPICRCADTKDYCVYDVTLPEKTNPDQE